MCKELMYCIIDAEVTDKVNKGQPLPSVRTSGRARSSTYHSGDCFHRNQRISTAYCRKLRRHGLLWRPVVYRSKYLTVLLIATTLTIFRLMQIHVVHFIWHGQDRNNDGIVAMKLTVLRNAIQSIVPCRSCIETDRSCW